MAGRVMVAPGFTPLVTRVLPGASSGTRHLLHVLFGSLACWHGMLHMQAMPQTATLSACTAGLVLATTLLVVAGMTFLQVQRGPAARLLDLDQF